MAKIQKRHKHEAQKIFQEKNPIKYHQPKAKNFSIRANKSIYLMAETLNINVILKLNSTARHIKNNFKIINKWKKLMIFKIDFPWRLLPSGCSLFLFCIQKKSVFGWKERKTSFCSCVKIERKIHVCSCEWEVYWIFHFKGLCLRIFWYFLEFSEIFFHRKWKNFFFEN